MHYPNAIELFGSPNGTCTSQTEAKHKDAVKEPWRRSNHNRPIMQMVQTITRLDKLTALRRIFKQRGMLAGSIIDHMTREFLDELPPILPWNGPSTDVLDNGDGDNDDTGPVSGAKNETMIYLAAKHRKVLNTFENAH